MRLVDTLVQFVLSGVMTGSIYALIALGFNIIFSATGAINFAQGEFAMLGGMLASVLLTGTGLPLPVVFVLAVAAVTAIGALMERLAIEPVRNADILNLIIITIGASIFLKGGVMVLLGKNAAGLPAFSGEVPLRLLGATFPPQAVWIVGVAFGVVVLQHLFFERTVLGKAMQATAIDREAASLMGVQVGRMVLLAFSLAAAVGAVAGIIITPVTLTIYDAGTMLGLKGFSAAVLGGLGSNVGGVVGGLALGLLESLGAGLIASQLKDAIAFFVLLVLLFVRPTGLLGRGEAERV